MTILVKINYPSCGCSRWDIIKLRKIFRYFIICISTCAVLTIGYLTPTKWYYEYQQNCDFNIYVSDGGIHTDIVVPAKTKVFDWKEHLSLESIGDDSDTNYNYLSFGWGDEAFFTKTRTQADFKLSTAFKALFFFNNPSVMHVQGYRVLPKSNNLKIKCVRISERGYLKLMEFIDTSFKTDDSGRKIRIANGYYSYDGFYSAKGSYSLLRNCNSWTAEGLRLAHVNTPLWSALSSAIMLHLNSGCECHVAPRQFVIDNS